MIHSLAGLLSRARRESPYSSLWQVDLEADGFFTLLLPLQVRSNLPRYEDSKLKVNQREYYLDSASSDFLMLRPMA